ncbi:hypothetical protein OIY81_1374 [Cryptosporidium canis]|uniref:2-methoxy-6-polyprenyl-1,4-benzoquinol methylase, mitochondrial n=1 Tax=Cryptosporidium canis TaxID=195482 RepID=A0ABQ8P3C6_9CRYT|nr:hypothetical protein OJ252_3193 [Cryptosporidium canis]KAJ1612266.1 hypothetical protein OIY81_1374 [Cryptosporidium canis]
MNRLSIIPKSGLSYRLSRSLVWRTPCLARLGLLSPHIRSGLGLAGAARLSSTKKHPEPEDEDKYVYFGDRRVDRELKRKLIDNVFTSVSSKYDLMNDLMSLGLHRCWKDVFVDNIISPESFLRIKREDSDNFSDVTILDVAGGTGDISFRIVDKLRKDNMEVFPRIMVIDSNSEMLQQGQLRSLKKGDSNIIWIKDDGEKLEQIPSNSVDVVAISFGIRNFADIEKGLRTFYRVLKPGGRFLCLEFSKVNNPLISSIYQLYSSIVIPNLGELVVGDKESYDYLVESIRRFPDAEGFAQLLIDANFTDVKSSTMTFGVVAIHSGFKPVETSD